MPVNKAARFRFDIIDECLRNAKKKWSKAELLRYVNRRLESHFGEGTCISASQLRYDIGNMQSEYGAPIEMYKHGRSYYYCYDDPEFSIKAIPVNEEDLIKLNEAVNLLRQIRVFTMADEVAEVITRIESRYKFTNQQEQTIIAFEGTADMQGGENLEDIYYAIIRKNVLKITYQTFHSVNAKEWYIHPYLLKEYNNRWYLLGYAQEKEHTVVFALDRMKEIKISKLAYLENTFLNSDDYFRDVIGVTVFPDRIVEEIELLFSLERAPYILTQPIHSSQNVIQQNMDGTIHVELNVIINPELLSILLSYGKDVKILRPLHLAEQIHNIATTVIQYYADLGL